MKYYKIQFPPFDRRKFLYLRNGTFIESAAGMFFSEEDIKSPKVEKYLDGKEYKLIDVPYEKAPRFLRYKTHQQE